MQILSHLFSIRMSGNSSSSSSTMMRIYCWYGFRFMRRRRFEALHIGSNRSACCVLVSAVEVSWPRPLNIEKKLSLLLTAFFCFLSVYMRALWAMKCISFFSRLVKVSDPVYSRLKPQDQSYCDCTLCASRGIIYTHISFSQCLLLQWNGILRPLLIISGLPFESTCAQIRVDCV